jgi:endonuclease/exonuclease/phosphatase family metal-dependent hydrolase
MRIGTLNVHSGRGRDGRILPGLLARATRSLGCDVLALQEVDHGQPRSRGEDQAAVVAEAVGAVDHRFAATVAGQPGGTWVPATAGSDGPRYGIALVSRWPVSSWRVVPLPPLPRYLPVRLPVPVPGRPLPLLVREEPRVALVAVVEGPQGPVTVATTHLSFVPGWSGHQLRVLAGELAAGRTAGSGPVLLAGDLNLGPSAAARASGMRHLVRGLTWPAERPLRQLDHVLGAGLGPADVVRSEVVRTEVSDHCALVVDLAPDRGEQNLNSQTYNGVRDQEATP